MATHNFPLIKDHFLDLEINSDLAKYGYLILDIGLDDQTKKSDRFVITVANCLGLTEAIKQGFDRSHLFEINHLLIAENFDKEEIINQVFYRINQIKGKSWNEISEKLSSFMEYEFNPPSGDYRHNLKI